MDRSHHFLFKKISLTLLAAAVCTFAFAKARPKSADPNVKYEPVTVTSTDTRPVTPRADGANRDIRSVSVTSDGKTLTVKIQFAAPPSGNSRDRISLMVDDVDLGKEKTSFTDRLWKNPATYTKVSTSVEFYSFEVIDGSLAPGGNGNMKSDAVWKLNPSTGLYTASSSVITYTIPLTSIKDSYNSALPEDTFRVVVFFSDYWTDTDVKLNGTVHTIEVVPSSAALVTSTGSSNDTLSVDFSGALVVPPLKPAK